MLVSMKVVIVISMFMSIEWYLNEKSFVYFYIFDVIISFDLAALSI